MSEGEKIAERRDYMREYMRRYRSRMRKIEGSPADDGADGQGRVSTDDPLEDEEVGQAD